MLKVRSIRRQLGNFLLEDIDFTVEEGGYFVLLGESGTGKSVLLEIIIGLMTPDSGSIHLKGRNLAEIPVQERNIAIVYQKQDIFPHMSVYNNIAWPLRVRNTPESEIKEKVEKIAAELNIDYLDRQDPATLSAGQSQKVALARALVVRPACLLMDEPLAAMDTVARSEMRMIFRRLNRQGLMIVRVTHDTTEAFALAKTVGVINQGKLLQTGKPDEIFKRPVSRFVAEFTGIRNYFQGRVTDDKGPVFRSAELTIRLRKRPEIFDSPARFIIKSDRVRIARKEEQLDKENIYKGWITDLEPAQSGMEISIDAGCAVHSFLPMEEYLEEKYEVGDSVCLSFDASDGSLIPGEHDQS